MTLNSVKQKVYQFDFLLVFLVILLTVYFLLGKVLFASIFVAQTAASFYYLVKTLIAGRSINLIKLILIFVVAVATVQGIGYALAPYLGGM
jgi:hypothetical protein